MELTPSRGIKLALAVLAPLAVFAAMIAADRMFGAGGRGYDYITRIELPPARAEIGLPPVSGPQDASRPLVVIDPGHGGHDPGAGTGEIKEKAVTLALARALRDRLVAEGGIRVALTRDDDRFLVLDERSGIAQRLHADLFISIHADSATDTGAVGATVYTLSERGSDQIAQAMADRENRADMLNGTRISGQSDAVSAILVDLSQRDAQARSSAFARLVLREGKAHLAFRPQPLQSAAFVVLKSPDMPSVLFEAGYISNDVEAARLASDEGRGAFAEAMARAIRIYFARQSAL